jgi:hypothetical protein
MPLLSYLLWSVPCFVVRHLSIVLSVVTDNTIERRLTTKPWIVFYLPLLLSVRHIECACCCSLHLLWISILMSGRMFQIVPFLSCVGVGSRLLQRLSREDVLSLLWL